MDEEDDEAVEIPLPAFSESGSEYQTSESSSSPDDIETHISEEDNNTAEAASKWAANFQPPRSPGEIKIPSRQTAGTRSRIKPPKYPTKERAKRLKSFYSDEYRKLLNVDIKDASMKMLQDDFEPVQPSQIGSSIWTAMEKDIFFSALARLGRDDVRGIANRIMTKSEVEVQQYIQLLYRNMAERKSHFSTYWDFLSTSHDFPAANEISEECCAIMERAGQALSSREQLAEEQTEEDKWGDSWLITKSVARWLDKRRREKGGEKKMQEVLPAINLFDTKTWLELSRDIFMNPGSPHEEDNWQNIAEPNETPAIRATAFEDFHSLAVSITKRLVSTTLFCTMSRLRAKSSKRGSKGVKYAEVNAADVEAAVKILALKSDSEQFWLSAARRCHLRVIDTETEHHETSDDERESTLAYYEVENTLRSLKRSRSRSVSRRPSKRLRSSSRHSSIHGTSSSEAEPDANDSDSMSSLLDDESDFPDSDVSTTAHAQRVRHRQALQKANDEFTDVCDLSESRIEETRLWDLLQQTAPFEIKAEPVDREERPPKVRNSKSEVEGNWRDYTEYWSQWEMMKSPVTEDEFEKNRVRKSRKRRRVESLDGGGQSEGSSVDGDEHFVVDSEEDVGGKISEDADGHQNDMTSNSFGKQDVENLDRGTESDDGGVSDASGLLSPDSPSVPLDVSDDSIEAPAYGSE